MVCVDCDGVDDPGEDVAAPDGQLVEEEEATGAGFVRVVEGAEMELSQLSLNRSLKKPKTVDSVLIPR